MRHISERFLDCCVILFFVIHFSQVKASQYEGLLAGLQREPNFTLTDRTLRAEDGVLLDQTVPDWGLPAVNADKSTDRLPTELSSLARKPPLDLKSRLRPRLHFQAEWEPQVGGLEISSYEMSVQMPTYPILGPPPPLVTFGYSLTSIGALPSLDLPETLHEISIGLTWMRRINDNWMARFMLDAAFVSDLDNTSSDAWQVRAGGFAIYRPNERWSWALGALATGRDDIPVIPAVGAIWEPSPELRIDLMLPNPRISRLLADSVGRQHWGYVGGGFSGGTWAYDRAGGLADRLSYRAWQLVLGWETTPPRPPGTFGPDGIRFGAEVGYVFGRKFEFDSKSPDISPRNTLLLRTRINF
jgi:hypothetical protein